MYVGHYKKYDSILSIRLNNQFYKFLLRLNPHNISHTIRSLIRVDLYGGQVDVNDKDVNKMYVCFGKKERDEIKEYIYYDKKSKHVNVRLYNNEKELIKIRSNGNINNYIDLIIMDFINNIDCKYNQYRWDGLKNESNL